MFKWAEKEADRIEDRSHERWDAIYQENREMVDKLIARGVSEIQLRAIFKYGYINGWIDTKRNIV